MKNSNFNDKKQKYKDYILYRKRKINKIKNPKPSVFFDRDGVIIEDCHYIKNHENVKLCPGVKDFIRYLHNQKHKVIIITNQSGISRKYLTWQDYEEVTSKLINLLGSPNPITAIYANSFTDKEDGSWRKPNPGMILQAAEDYCIDLDSSILIGDRKTDLDAGLNAGIKKLVHVLTGHGESERERIVSKIDKNGNYTNLSQKAKLFLVPNLNSFMKILEE